jgi:hypothetical protein
LTLATDISLQLKRFIHLLVFVVGTGVGVAGAGVAGAGVAGAGVAGAADVVE